MKLEFPGQIIVATELFRADRRPEMTKLIVAFSNFAKRAKKKKISQLL